MMKSIVVIGNFGNKNRVNGQILRTQTIYNSILKNYKDCYIIKKIDTANKHLIVFFRAIFAIITSSKIVILPAQSAIKPLLLLINILRRTDKTVHVAIGGWILDSISTPFWEKIEKKLKSVLVQTLSIKNNMTQKGFENVVYFPNYRENYNEVSEIQIKTNARKFVFYSRIIPEKGVFEAIRAIDDLYKNGADCTLDIYGPIENEVIREKIDMEIANKREITYKGVLNQGQIIRTLNSYDVMLFPTYYRGEGFPGAILESFLAGLPVIATNWKYNNEIVVDGYTGLICSVRSVEDLKVNIKKIMDDDDIFVTMQKNCIEESKQYKAENVEQKLYESLGV